MRSQQGRKIFCPCMSKRENMKSTSKISTPEAFYRLFQALPAKERFAAAKYILEDEQVRHHFKIPNEMTLAAFAEDKHDMPVFTSMDALRKDLLQ